jgi:mono/diheme cytochrome c family protein
MKSLLVSALILSAAVFSTKLPAESTESSPAEPDAVLSQRVADLESELTQDRREDAVRRGAKTFARVCASCHSSDGAAEGYPARNFKPRPRNLTVNHYRFRSTRTGAAPRPEDFDRVIRHGLPGTSMTGLGNLLSDDEISDLIWFLYSLDPLTAEMDEPPEALPIPELLPDDPSRRGDGRAMYILMGCWTCHGMKGAGNGHAAKGLTDNDGRPIRSTDFRYDPLKASRDPKAIVRSVLTGLNGAPTPAYGDAAILVTSEFVIEDVNLLNVLQPQDRATIDRFLKQSPSASELAAMSDAERGSLRDGRLYDLAYYLLSMDRRKGVGYWFFRQRPEREARKP